MERRRPPQLVQGRRGKDLPGITFLLASGTNPAKKSVMKIAAAESYTDMCGASHVQSQACVVTHNAPNS